MDRRPSFVELLPAECWAEVLCGLSDLAFSIPDETRLRPGFTLGAWLEEAPAEVLGEFTRLCRLIDDNGGMGGPSSEWARRQAARN